MEIRGDCDGRIALRHRGASSTAVLLVGYGISESLVSNVLYMIANKHLTRSLQGGIS